MKSKRRLTCQAGWSRKGNHRGHIRPTRRWRRRVALFWAPLALAAGGVLNASESFDSRTPVGPLEMAMDRTARCCVAWLNPENHYLPIRGYEDAHDVGRWWDAMLRYENRMGVRIPELEEKAMMRNLRAMTDNSAALLVSEVCNPHNLRETMLAYTALVRHRKSDWARSQGHKLVQTMSELLKADGQLDYEALAERMGKPLTTDPLMALSYPQGQWFSAVGSTGRAIEAILDFYEETGDPVALELARRLSEAHLRHVIDPTGSVRAELLDPNHVSHTHSYYGTLRGLLRFGLITGDRQYVDAVANTYRKGLLGTTISYSGWTPHDQGKIRFPNKDGDPLGEHGSCSDATQVALWLALQDGQTDLLDDVERLVRARLLPAQIIDPSNPEKDGSWGVYSHPFSQGSIIDVFAAVLHSLVDIHQNIVTTSPEGVVSVNLHFDIDTPSVSVRSVRGAEAALRITVKKEAPLRVRVPGWASRDSVRLTSSGKELPLRWDDAFLVVGGGTVKAGSEILLRHDLPLKHTVEEMPVSHRRFHLTWRGDEVVACQPKVPIYPAEESQ